MAICALRLYELKRLNSHGSGTYFISYLSPNRYRPRLEYTELITIEKAHREISGGLILSRLFSRIIAGPGADVPQ